MLHVRESEAETAVTRRAEDTARFPEYFLRVRASGRAITGVEAVDRRCVHELDFSVCGSVRCQFS